YAAWASQFFFTCVETNAAEVARFLISTTAEAAQPRQVALHFLRGKGNLNEAQSFIHSVACAHHRPAFHLVFSLAWRRADGRENREQLRGAERRAERAGGLAAMARA